MKDIFSSRLAKLRAKSGLSQKQFAGQLNIAPGSMSNYENGIYLPPLEKAVAMAKELHTSLDYMTGLSDKNIDPALFAKPITEKITFTHLIKLLCSLEENNLVEIMRFAEYLKYKKKRSTYTDQSKPLLVAEEGSKEH